MKNVFEAQILELYPVVGFWAKIILQKKLEQVRNYCKYNSGFEQVFEDL